MPKQIVRTTYLQMTEPGQLRPATRTNPAATITRAEVPSPELNRYMYSAVGGDWYWGKMLTWTYEQWREFIEQPGFETWILAVRGTPAGYYELVQHDDSSIEILHFGLIPAFIGQGLGGQLLTHALQRAWTRQPSRVWLHTCTLDHPLALKNYQARGLQIYKEEEDSVNLPETSAGPWPGAERPSVPTVATEPRSDQE